MALLKSLIQRLLDSRTTPSEAGHSAMPGSVSTTLLSNASISDWGTVATGTAADDGYLVLNAKNGGTLLRPVRTVTLRSQETPRVSFWKFPQAARGLLIAEHLQGDTSFLSQKVSNSHTWCHLIQLLTRFSLSQCGLKTNSAVGGASC